MQPRSVISFLLFSAFCFHIECAWSVCPEGYKDPGGDFERCFKLVSDSHSWIEARISCMDDGGELMSLLYVNEKNWVQIQLDDYNSRTGLGYWWTGLSSMRDPSIWEWSDGTPTDYRLINWQSGQPPRPARRCGLLHHSGFTERACDSRYPFICTRSKNVLLTCPLRWTEINQNCYIFHDSRKSWQDARNDCWFYGGDLVDVISEDELNFTHALAANDEQSTWIGLKSYNSLEQNRVDWCWANKKQLDPSLSFWAEGEPNIEVGKENSSCALMRSGNDFRSSWFAAPCNETTTYVCKRPTVPEQCHTRPEALLYKGACYDIRRDANLDHETSRFACQNLGGELASLHDQDEAEFVHKMSNRGEDVMVMNLWIGLVREPNDKSRWQWLDNTTVNFLYWAGEGPALEGDCVDMDRNSGHWLNLDCDAQRGYVCKYADVLPATHTTPVWTTLNGRETTSDQSKTWTTRRPWWLKTSPQSTPITLATSDTEGLSVSSIAAIVLGIVLALVLVLFVALLINAWSGREAHQDSLNVTASMAFSNDLYTENDTPTLKLDDIRTVTVPTETE